ncbi:hypothetical protein [Moorena sp. SIO3H5]|uniref:hypothetical protein n=1 Tax=Moorena sp. SIO3H5 TaxID=2607834 RepID=UPI0013BAC264|nr:hypothetical protein [Moorena sp. SIO3H5]NEO74607.1 hypothetical protein [Moorena sp. SIO3H5]
MLKILTVDGFSSSHAYQKSDARYEPLRDEAFRQSRRYANAKRGLRPQLPLKAISPKGYATRSHPKLVCI